MNAESQLPELVPAGAPGKNTAEELFFIARRDSNTLKFALFSGVQSAVFSTCTRLCAVTPVTFRNVFTPGRKTPYPGASPPHSRPPAPDRHQSTSRLRGVAPSGHPIHTAGVVQPWPFAPAFSHSPRCSRDAPMSQPVLGLHSLSGPKTIPWCGCGTSVTRSARMDVGWRPLLDDRACGRCAFLVFSGAYLIGELLSHVIDCVTVPPATCEGSSVCTTLAAIRIFITTILVGLKWYFMASMCISLTTRDAGHLSTCLLASMCLLCRNSDPMLSFDWVIRLFALCVF